MGFSNIINGNISYFGVRTSMYGTTEFIVILLIILSIAALFMRAIYRLARKSGHSGWWCLTALFIPSALLTLLFLGAANKQDVESRPKDTPS
jgi:uncharacterized membrane protein YhaH (DUF805 family)